MISKYDNLYMILCWRDVMRIRWWLRSTMGSYWWFMLEVSYGDMIFHSIEVVWEILLWKVWLGCRHDTSFMVDILGLHQCGRNRWYFLILQYKTYMYYVLKIYSIMKKKSTGGLWHYPGPTMFRECFRPPMVYFFNLKRKIHRFSVDLSE